VTTRFPDPAAYGKIPVYDLLKAAARGYAALDMRLIRAIVDRGQQAVPDIVRFAMEDRDDDRVDLEEDLIAVLRHLQAPEGLPYFIECIRREPQDIPDDIIEAIMPFREQALEPLLALYEELDESESGDLAFLLAGLRIGDERILKILLERLEFDAGDGAFSLGLYGDPAAVPALERVLSEVSKEDAELRRELQFAIEELNKPSAEPEQINHKFDLSQYYAEQATPPYEVLDPEELVAMLGSDSPEHRAAAAEGLRNEQFTDETLKVVLEHARNDPDAAVRGRCWEALADTDSAEIRKSMKQVVADVSRDPAERGGALVGLSNSSDDPEVSATMREFYGIAELRAKAMEAMWRSFDRQFATFFAKHLNEPDQDIRRQAVWGVGYMGIGAEASKLREMFDDDTFRHDALFAYALCVPGEFTRGRVRSILRKIDTAAGGLSAAEAELVQTALDQRLAMHGLEPVFAVEGDNAAEEKPGPRLVKKDGTPDPGRNDPCPCGSGKKYKKCHGA
jgi:HEAT repeat protein